MTASYALDTSHTSAGDHHQALSDLLNVGTCERIDQLTTLDSARVLELGAGHGSLARMFADAVAPAGEVVAVDLDTTALQATVGEHPAVTIVRADLQQFPWPGEITKGWFDLTHARLTLGHLPAREEILSRAIDSTGPGGVILIEDWAANRDPQVVAAPNREAADLFCRYQRAAGEVFRASGVDFTWGPRIHELLTADPRVVEVETQIRGGYWVGGGPGCRLLAATIPQIADRLTGYGLDPEDLGPVVELLHDPGLVVVGHPLYSVSAVRA